jgi:hypothetical protein
MLMQSLQISFKVIVGCSRSSLKAFDYLMLVTDVSKLMAFEIFYLNVAELFHGSYEKVVALPYPTEGALASSSSRMGRYRVFREGVASFPLCIRAPN